MTIETMPDELSPPENQALRSQSQPDADRNDPAAQDAASMHRRAPLTRGQSWHAFEIDEPLPCEVGWCFHAVNVTSLEEVIIRVLPAGDHLGMRAKAWDELCAIKMPQLVQSFESCEEDGFRFEISACPPETSLREWASCRQASIDDAQQLMQQLGLVLDELHDRGVAHLNLRPETIYVASADSGLQIVIGGLENATLYNQPGLVPVPVDPLYAPPEAVGLTKHQPGAGLRAWDWWSVGRTVQEIVLGRHVLGFIMGRDVSRPTPEVRTRAEDLLFERDPKAPRAGAVEVMPPMHHRLGLLLRGLLTSSRDGRWGFDEVQRWLAQETVNHRYQLGRSEELFPWKDRMFTISEAAEYFSAEEHWPEGIANLFDTNDPATLVSFVGERPGYAPIREQIETLQKFALVPNWVGLSEDAIRTAVAAAAWLLFGPDGTKLTVCGRRLDNECLRGLLTRGSSVNGVHLIRALTAQPYVQMIEKEDPAAARVLGSLAQIINGDLVADAGRRGWIDLTAEIDCARLYHFALEPKKRLEETLHVLRTRYACVRDSNLQALFARPSPSPEELVVLACTAANPERHGFVSHDQWNREQHAEFVKNGQQVGRALFWLRLRRALLAAWLVSGWWPVVVPLWVVIAAVQTWLTTLWPSVAVLGTFVLLRFLAIVFVNTAITRNSPSSPKWRWNTRIRRCLEESRAATGGTDTPTMGPLRAAFAAVNARIVALPLEPRLRPLPPLGEGPASWVVAVAVWVIVLGTASEMIWRRPDALVQVDGPAALTRPVDLSGAVLDPTPDEMFLEDSRLTRVPWDIVPPPDVPEFPLAAIKPASSDQIAAAIVDGQRLLRPYSRGSVGALIAVQVEDADGTGVMIYDGRSQRIVRRHVLLPTHALGEKSWFEFNNLRFYYPGNTPVTKPTPLAGTAEAAAASTPPPDLPEKEMRAWRYADMPTPAE